MYIKKESERKPFAGYRLLGLGFWQAWWMISMVTGALLPTKDHYPFAGSTTLWILVLTTLGYLVIVLLSRRLSPFSSRRISFFLAGGCTTVGSLILPFSLTVINGAFGFGVFFIASVLVSVGNALLLIMWGELWSTLATGRVGRHLYFSYSFAFVLFFIGYFLSSPFNAIFTAILPSISALVLFLCKDEPKRSPAVMPLEKKSIPYLSIFLCIFTISVLYGFSQGVVGSFSNGQEDGLFLAKGFLLAGAGIVAIALSMVVSPVENESIALYRPVIPAMTAGILALIVVQPPYEFVGNGLIIMGIYCLDMLIMLTSTDIAYRARIPVASSFGFAILATRSGTLIGSFTANGFIGSDIWSPLARNNILLLGVLALIFIGMVFFTQSDMQKFYQIPSTTDTNQDSLQDRCDRISSMCGLTARESEVLILLARGKTVQGVCDELVIARGTAKHHVSSIYRKVGVFDRQSLHSVVEHGNVGKGAID